MKPTGTAVAKRIDMSLRSHLCLEIGEFLKAKTPIFFKIVFSRIFNILKEQMTSNEVSCPTAILFWGSRIQDEVQADLALQRMRSYSRPKDGEQSRNLLGASRPE